MLFLGRRAWSLRNNSTLSISKPGETMTCKFEWWDQQFPSAYCASVLTGGGVCRFLTVFSIKSDIHGNTVIYLALTVSMAVIGLA